MFYGKQGVDFTSKLLYPEMENGVRLSRATSKFYVVSDNPDVSLGTDNCALYPRLIAL